MSFPQASSWAVTVFTNLRSPVVGIKTYLLGHITTKTLVRALSLLGRSASDFSWLGRKSPDLGQKKTILLSMCTTL